MLLKNTGAHLLTFASNCINQLVADAKKRVIQKRRIATGLTAFPYPDEVLNANYLFVLSTGRCGTGLLTKILNSSRKLYVEHNPKPELEYVSSLIHRENVDLNALKIAILAARFDAFFLPAFLTERTFVETNNRISFFAPGLAELLPKSKFIHLVRDPADFIRSGMRRGYYKQGVIQHQRLDGSKIPGWNSFSRIEKIAWEWNEINAKIEDFKSTIDDSRVLTIRSESLYSDPASTYDIFRFIGDASPFSDSNGQKNLAKLLAKPVNKQHSGSFPKYPDWKDSEKKSLKEIAILAPSYGYFYK